VGRVPHLPSRLRAPAAIARHDNRQLVGDTGQCPTRRIVGARTGGARVVSSWLPASWIGRAGAVLHGARELRPCRQAPGNDLNEEPGSVVYSDAVVYRGGLIASRVAALALLGMSLVTAGNVAQSGSGADLAAPRLIRPAPYASVSEPITFQWTEVNGAAAYGIEIRNAPANAGQVVVSEKVTEPRFTAGALPARPLWWRVRAVGSSGAPGTWSPARRFEPRSPPLAVSVFAITLTPPAVSGGYPSEGLVTLTIPAPAGGATVSLSTSDNSTATVPHHVVVTAGSKSAAFSVKTAPVPEERSVRVSGTPG